MSTKQLVRSTAEDSYPESACSGSSWKPMSASGGGKPLTAPDTPHLQHNNAQRPQRPVFSHWCDNIRPQARSRATKTALNSNHFVVQQDQKRWMSGIQVHFGQFECP